MSREPTSGPLLGPVRAALVALGLGAFPSAQAPRLGTVDFPTSGAARAQPYFIRGVLLLHSFEYRDAATAFREAQQADPGFALAYWGEALTYTHPLWNEQDRSAARAVLERLAPTPGARRALAPTPREKAYLHAVEVLYGEGPKTARDTAYSAAMERVVASYPKDREAQVFYALSLLGLNQGVRDVPTYLRAAALLEPVFRENPDHPGAAHLLIHCYDDPIHAARGLPAARAYAKIAPDAAHAQHMTTHIFLALGMWDEVVSQNEIASGRDRRAWTPYHYTDWLGYGYLQQGRYGEALRLLDLMFQNADRTTGRGLAVLAQMRADYVVNTERWESPSLQWSIDLAHANSRARAVDAFARGFSALKRGDRAAAQAALAGLAALNRSRPAPETGYVDPVPGVLYQELRAAAWQAQGALAEAIALMHKVTSLEDAMPLEFGPPGVVKPSHELLGELLLRAGRPDQARAEFERALRLAPQRALSLLGRARAVVAAGGDARAAARAYEELRGIWHRADPDIPGLAEATRFLAARQ